MGTNGVSVYSYSTSAWPCLLAHRRAITQWTHVAVVVNQNTVAVAINGATAEIGMTSPLSLRLFLNYIGGDPAKQGPYSGMIDELRVYDRVLSDDELQTIYSAEFNQDRCFRMESLNVPGYYWNYTGTLTNESTSLFRTVTGLASDSTVTFESCDQPGVYLRHRFVAWQESSSFDSSL